MNPSSFDLETALECAWPPAEWRDVHLVLAVSGGADSVAMLQAMRRLKERVGGRGRLFAAHFDHGLRGAESVADAQWVADLCQHLEVPLQLGQADVAAAAAEQGDGWEAAARTARYNFLREAAERIGARFIATAHTADDQVETVLHRLIRGTGIAGLAGIPRVRALSTSVSLVRPLLDVRRANLLEYLTAVGQHFREDSTNTDRRFTRNRLRHDLLPLLRHEFNAEVDDALLRLARQAEAAQAVIAQRASELAARCVSVKRSDDAAAAISVEIDGRSLAGEPPLIVGEVCRLAWTAAGWPLQDMGYKEWSRLAEMATSGGSAKTAVFPGGVAVEIRSDTLLLRA